MIKRLFDIFVCLLLLTFSPVLLIVAILVRINLGRPILYTQKRPGLNGAVFKLIKFRTMLDAIGKEGNQLPDEQRMTL